MNKFKLKRRMIDEGFEAAKRIALRIIKEAGGRVCGDCLYYRVHYCGFISKAIPEWGVEIFTPKAVACSMWKKREEE